ncbi:MAG: ABC transporter permease [Dongiaceae bacterium]
MIRYLAKRLLWSAAILLGVSVITFALNNLVPSDPVAMIAARSATKEDRDRLRQQLGLDQPVAVQYGRYMGKLLQGDLGRSYKRRTQVAAQIWARLPATLMLMAAAIGFELLIGLPAGLYAARRRGSGADKAAMTLSFIGVSSPQFVTGLILFYIFAYWLSWLPTGGFGAAHIILPAVTLGIAGGGWYSRMMRSSMVDVLRQDYIRTARAKGLSERGVLFVHAFRNAVLPIVAMIGLDIGIFMSGVVVVESVFGWPGIGQLMWQAIQDRDGPIILGVTLTAAVFIVLGNLLADVIAPLIDPRIRLR